jgi:hypothetical protein
MPGNRRRSTEPPRQHRHVATTRRTHHALDFNKSTHFPGKVSISFYAPDIQACIDELNSKGVEIVQQFGDPVSAIVLQDPDGCRVEIKKQHG